MLQVSKIIAQGKGLAPVLVKRASTVELDWDVRQKSRFDATDSTGRQLGVFLPRGTVVRGGDVMLAEDGSMVKVIAAAQTVLRITHCSEHGSSLDLMRAAYHLGNRHVAIELKADHLKIEVDHVLAEMLQAMHLIVNEVSEAFEPEAGAYSQEANSHASHASHSAHAAAKPAPHVHGPNCNHGHDDHAPAAAAPVTEPVKAAPHVHGPDCNHGHDDHAQIKPVAIQIHKHKPH
ncbi:Urease accessory protein UreE [Polaromonas vacuolata]|uniref:Urease accessory protein UreE n=1 Tax=Polaromonas vacuolata TaxID=37448 RepID=A0A6H2H6B6_9BURK|nr:urease accessory protein UreE [Polaromonas vacuolata]QJC55422.1 Urease accessory protein UreE [Polaromonas vacuolata]